MFDLTAPSNDITSDSIKLAWTLGFDGNANITGVNITYIATSNFASPHSGFEMVSGQRTEAIIEDLQPLTTYEFTVVVLNSVSDEVGSSSEESVSTMTAPLGELFDHTSPLTISHSPHFIILSHPHTFVCTSLSSPQYTNYNIINTC